MPKTESLFAGRAVAMPPGAGYRSPLRASQRRWSRNHAVRFGMRWDGRRRTKLKYSTSFALKTAFRRTTCCGGSRCSFGMAPALERRGVEDVPTGQRRRQMSILAHGQVRAPLRRCRAQMIDGYCPNTNCLPSKREIWSAKVGDLVCFAQESAQGRFCCKSIFGVVS